MKKYHNKNRHVTHAEVATADGLTGPQHHGEIGNDKFRHTGNEKRLSKSNKKWEGNISSLIASINDKF